MANLRPLRRLRAGDKRSKVARETRPHDWVNPIGPRRFDLMPDGMYSLTLLIGVITVLSASVVGALRYA